MINLLYVVSNLNKAGPTNQLSYIIKYINNNKFNIFVLTLSEDDDNSMKDYFINILKVKVDSLAMSRVKGLFFAEQKIKQYIERYKINIIHSQGIRQDKIINKIKQIPTISTIRNYPYYDYKMKRGDIIGNIMAYIHTKIIKNNQNKFIACSNSVANEFLKNNIRIKYIQNGIDTEIYQEIKVDDKVQKKKSLNLPLNKTIFISVGALIYRKNMSTVIKAFNEYNKSNDSILLILGEGIEKKALQLVSNDNIYFLGNVSNVIEYLQVSDCFISASLAEGLPNSVLEAMSVGLPTILSNIPSHLEIYEEENKYFFNPKDYLKLVNLFYNIENNFTTQSSISKQVIKERFDASFMSKKYQDIYVNLMKPPKDGNSKLF